MKTPNSKLEYCEYCPDATHAQPMDTPFLFLFALLFQLVF